MRSTYLEWRDGYSNALFSSAELVDGALRVEVRVWGPVARFFGLPKSLVIPIGDVRSVQVVRQRVSRIKLARVVVSGPSGDEIYLFSAWVGSALLAGGAPAARSELGLAAGEAGLC